jgi:radical SAM superfamily enzyme YgiQ (UPF0313 family)
MKILIVTPKFNDEYNPQYNFPVGLACIKGALREKGYDVIALNLNHVWDGNSVLKNYILDNKVDVVMTGGISVHYHIIKSIFKVAKSANKEIITIGGGGGFTSEPVLFAEMAEVDYACLGEGEATICELVEAITTKKDMSTVQGIVYKNASGQYIQNKEKPVVENLDTLPFPDYEGFEMEKYLEDQKPSDYYFTYFHDEPRMFPIFMGRSCPYQCNFCFHPLGNKYRQRSLDNFFMELDLILRKYKVNSLAIFDELFSLEEKRVFEFCDRIKDYGLKWSVQMRVDIVNEKLLVTMRDAGCFNISYGIESINDKVLKNMKKHTTKAEIENAMEVTYDCGVGIQGNFIFGDEEEDMNTFSETLNWWKDHRKYQINLAFIETYPGTQLYKNAIKRGLITDKKEFIENDCPLINLTKQPDHVFKNMQNIVSLATFNNREMMGEVLGIERYPLNSEFSTVTFKCYHCNKISTIKKIYSKRLYSNRFKMSCRHCNQKNVYDTRAYLKMLKQRDLDQLLMFCEKYSYVVCYGAGAYGYSVHQFLKDNNIMVKFFLVSEPIAENTIKDGIPVYSICDKTVDLKECGILLSLHVKYQSDVRACLKKYCVKDDSIYGISTEEIDVMHADKIDVDVIRQRIGTDFLEKNMWLLD